MAKFFRAEWNHLWEWGRENSTVNFSVTGTVGKRAEKKGTQEI
ncbi:hypothetical protein BGP_0752 [Beggiatoa sp. PS]|nr:hypothetical protein BGP_0752 [Beggiatoa sp. PS]